MAKKQAATKKGAPKPTAPNPTAAAPKAPAPASAPTKAPASPTASMFCFPRSLPPDFVAKVRELETHTGKEIWLLVQGGNLPRKHPYRDIGFPLLHMFEEAKDALPKPVFDPKAKKLRSNMAMLIMSGGGNAESAYRMAMIFRRRCRGFTAIVPRFAMSAATLLCLGADKILLGEDAELGPLDAQFFDYDVEEDWVSALDEVQALEALEQSAAETAFRVMLYFHERTGKKLNTLLPHAMKFAAKITQPLFSSIDAVKYCRQSRTLQEAQDYAERLLRANYSDDDARILARALVRNYPTHGFVINREEAGRIGKGDDNAPLGLKVEQYLDPKTEGLLNWLCDNTQGFTAVGRIK